jgi:CrcB protein
LGRQLLWVFLAGGLGASLRVLLTEFVDERLAERVPFIGTFVVNMVGCFAIGVAASVLAEGVTRTAVIGGLLGGFTTYSSFALLSVELARTDRTGFLLVQIVAHLALGMLCAAAGLWVGRAMASPG